MATSGPSDSGCGGDRSTGSAGWLCSGAEGGQGREAAGGGGRRKRRRPRAQRQKRRRPPHLVGGGGGVGGQIDHVSRERMFQDIEGLLRQIRERAEETPLWTEDQMNDFTQSVTGFMRAMDEEGGQISERALAEYHRVRDKLAQALKL